MQGRLLTRFLRIFGNGAGKHDVLSVGAPDSIGLHKLGIVGAGQRMTHACGAAIPLKDALGGIKHLKEAIVCEVSDVKGLWDVERRAGKGADYILAVGRDLRHEADSGLADLTIGVPLHYVLVLDGHLALHRD